jgi:hypothetical protein
MGTCAIFLHDLSTAPGIQMGKTDAKQREGTPARPRARQNHQTEGIFRRER